MSGAPIVDTIEAPISDTIANTVISLGRAPAFANALRALENTVARSGRTLRPIGTTGPPGQEAILFRAAPSLGFAPADIAAMRPGAGEWPAEMDVAFLGLYGPASPLPSSWTERIVMGNPGSDNVRDVLDLFNHPLIALSWRITRSGRVDWLWAPGIWAPGTTVPSTAPTDVPSTAALALAGIIPGAARADEDSASASPRLDPLRLLPLAGLLAQYSRGARVVAAIVSRYFGLPARIDEWIPARARIPADQQFRLGQPAATIGDASLGETVPDVSGVVRLVLGPLPLHIFVDFLPDGARRPALHALLALAIREPVRVELDLVMDPHGSAGMVLGATQLGWTSWADGPGEAGRTPAGSPGEAGRTPAGLL